MFKLSEIIIFFVRFFFRFYKVYNCIIYYCIKEFGFLFENLQILDWKIQKKIRSTMDATDWNLRGNGRPGSPRNQRIFPSPFFVRNL